MTKSLFSCIILMLFFSSFQRDSLFFCNRVKSMKRIRFENRIVFAIQTGAWKAVVSKQCGSIVSTDKMARTVWIMVRVFESTHNKQHGSINASNTIGLNESHSCDKRNWKKIPINNNNCSNIQYLRFDALLGHLAMWHRILLAMPNSQKYCFYYLI